jgi:multiple sugar transport system permease protein
MTAIAFAPTRPAGLRQPSRIAVWLDDRLAALFLAPGLACLGAVVLYPVLYNLVVSFTDMSLVYPSWGFVGVDNFSDTLADRGFWRAALTTLVWTIGSVAGQLLLGLIAALTLERITTGRDVLRLILIVPWAFPSIVMAFAWRFMLDPLYGVANHLLLVLRVIDQPVAWFATREGALPVVMLMNIWFGFPFMMVAIIAGLAAIPRELYEAARVDGASAWQEFVYITLPGLWRVISILVILRTIWVFNNFDFIYLTTGGGPLDATTTLPIHAFQVGWLQHDLGRMAAVSIVMIVLLSLVLAVYFRLLALQKAQP